MGCCHASTVEASQADPEPFSSASTPPIRPTLLSQCQTGNHSSRTVSSRDPAAPVTETNLGNAMGSVASTRGDAQRSSQGSSGAGSVMGSRKHLAGRAASAALGLDLHSRPPAAREASPEKGHGNPRSSSSSSGVSPGMLWEGEVADLRAPPHGLMTRPDRRSQMGGLRDSLVAPWAGWRPIVVPCALLIDRTEPLRSALGPVLARGPEDLRPGRVVVKYRGEEGEDGVGGGGVTRCFLSQVGGLLADVRLGLLLPGPAGHVQLSPVPGFMGAAIGGIASNDLQQRPGHWSRFLGRILGMAVAHECPLGLLLAPPLCKHLVGGQEPTFDDLRFVPGLNSEGGAGWYGSLRALLAHRAPDLVEDTPAMIGLDAQTVDEALYGLEAVMPSRTQQIFESLAAFVGTASCGPQRWEEAADVAAMLLRRASTAAQKELAAATSVDLVKAMLSIIDADASYGLPTKAAGRDLPPGVRRAVVDFCTALRTTVSQSHKQEITQLTQQGGDNELRRLLKTAMQEDAGLKKVAKALTAITTSSEPAEDAAGSPSLRRAISTLGDPFDGKELSAANLQAFAEGVTKKTLIEDLQPHVTFVAEEFRRVVPPHLLQQLSWKQVQDRISGQRLDIKAFVQEWRDKTTYQYCTEADRGVQLWWGYVSDRASDELFQLFAWCTGFATIPVTAWKFQIRLIEDTARCPTISTCMTDDSSVANRGIKMPTIYLPAYDSKAVLAQKMEWAVAGASAMTLF